MTQSGVELYQEGVPVHIDTRPWPSLAHMLDECWQCYGARDALTSLDTTLTFAGIERQSRAFAAWLQQDAGMVKGQRIGLMMPNCLQYVVTLLGSLRAGLVVVNVNPLHTARELEHQLADSGATTIVMLQKYAAKLEKVYDNVGVETVVTTRLGDFQTPTKRLLTKFAHKPAKKNPAPGSLPGVFDLRRVLVAGDRQTFSPPELGPDDLAFVQYTGTLGSARGAMLSHGNLVANVAQCRAWFEPEFRADTPTTIITALPMYHIFALTVNVLLQLCLGGRNILIADTRNLAGLVKTMARQPFDGITGSNSLFNGLLNTKGFSQLNFSRLRLAMAGGMAVQQAVAERWAEVTGVALIEGYGMSETSPVVACNPLNNKTFNHSVGVALPATEIRIANDRDQPVPADQPGELCVRGPQVMRGYWNSPDREPFTQDGFLRTGDIARQDEHGRIFIIDGKQDTIVVSGFQVYPNEIEKLMAAHAGVKETACIRVPDEATGEAVKLFVVKRDGGLSMENIRAYCREHLSAYQVPRHYAFVEEIPKSDVGAILRRQLR